jgi:SynChlorMet cassette radical SAM/SPASM protein ScmF
VTEVPTPPLRQLYLYLTEGCNLACRHCWLAPPYDPRRAASAVLPAATVARAIDEARALGLEAVKLTGGEPLLHPDIGAIVERVAAADLDLVIETNGTLFTPALADRLAALDGPQVSVSLDGATAAVHDAVRGVAGAFDAAVAGIRVLVERDMRPQIIFSLVRGNVAELEQMPALAASLGASSLKINVVQPTARGLRLQEEGGTLSVADLDVFFDQPPAFRPLSRLAEPGRSAVCGILTIIGVIPTGHYALCGIGQHVPELTFGRVGEDRLADVWASSRVLCELRSGLPDRLEGVCGACLVNRLCLGECIAQTYYRTGRLFAPYWFCEAAERVGLFPSTRKGMPISSVVAGPAMPGAAGSP